MNKIFKLFKYNILTDFSWSIAASLASTLALQIVVYPFLARILNAEKYGQLLTYIGVSNTIGLLQHSFSNNYAV